MSVPKMAPEAEPKPYNQNQKQIVDNLSETRLEGNHYIATDPEWVRTKSAEGAKIGRGRCSVCWRFWKFDRRVSPRSVPCLKCTYALTVVSFRGTGNIRISAPHIADGVSTEENRKF